MSSISRNWVGGLSSGLDTQSLITQFIKAESFAKFSLQRKRNTIGYQRDMLQEINLKLFEVQSKATDLTFSRTFNSKKIDASDPRVVNARATTEAAIGSYNIHVKQLATATTVSSKGKLAGALELGYNLASEKALGGSSTNLNALGVTPGDLEVRIIGGGSGTYDISTSATGASTLAEVITSINTSINNKPELKGKLNATFDEKNNRVKFNLLDEKMTLEVVDKAPGSIISSMFDAGGQIDLDKDIPSVNSSLADVRSGLSTTIADMGIAPGTFTLERTDGGIAEVFDISGLAPNTSVEELISFLNSEIDSKDSLVRGGSATGNPADRNVEFRFDDSSGKLRIVNTNSADSDFFMLNDGTSDFSDVLFGSPNKVSVLDKGDKLFNETFSQGMTSGVITVDGVQININTQTDTLQGVLSRITSLTDINASYDSKNDVIRLTRKDGSNNAIGVGSSNDSSNFLAVTGLIAGSQASAAELASSGNLGKTLNDVRTGNIAAEFGAVAGTLRVVVNGQNNDITYDGTETLSQMLDKISALDGVDQAYYDSTTGKVNITTKDKGSSASLEIQDIGGGNLGSQLGLASGAVNGLDTGSSLVSARPISDVKTSATLKNAGLAVPVKAGTFTINGVQFLINSTESMTLDSLISSINSNAKAGVKAHYDPTNGKFVLASSETGNRAVALGAPTDTSNFLSAMGLVGATQNVGTNSIYSVDGLYGGADQISQSNTISDAIDGVSFDIYDVTGPSGATINVEADTEVAKKAIEDFLESYNEVTTTIFSRLTEERNWELQGLNDEELSSLGDADLTNYESAFKVGLLSGDSTLRSIRSQMRLVMSSIVPGADKVFDSLTDIGISTGTVGSSYKDTMLGTLTITSSDKLEQALRENPDKIADLFAKDSTDRNSMGIARRLKETLNEFTKSDGLLTKRVGRSGVASSNSEMDKQIGLINKQITSQEERLKSREEALLKQFSALEKTLSDYQSQSSAFAGQLAQLTNNG